MIKFTMPMNDELAQKLTYTGKYYGRSRIKEIEWACKEWIRRFEEEQGPISTEDLQALKEAGSDPRPRFTLFRSSLMVHFPSMMTFRPYVKSCRILSRRRSTWA